MTANEQQLVTALERMLTMHSMMMEKVDHGASWYDADTLREMNEAPIQAARALGFVSKEHCQNGRADVCLAGSRDSICCADDECDIDNGIRSA